MNYKTHMNGGILVGLYANCQFANMPLMSTAVFLGGAFVGSIFPDIDHRNSYIGKKTKGVSKAINKLAGHRKLFHAPLIYLFLYSTVIGMFTDKLMLIGIKGIFLGIFSHLFLDSLTIGGLPWFYPFSKKRFSICMIKTNSKIEDILCGMLICINIVMLLDMLHITSIFTFTHR
ncbi:metal-dependent hydrolase [Clostridium beijerinckii]|uniref:Metal-dependent hydrolase n=1 Tax=Clostridium beijerinckii TaxID=1520 RepID=A0A1W7LUA9_CLOBE|nr:metal-dependent hydrolase [Clostridium beijerinckii]MBA8934854.1 inner membrane protein [Clostridium beijerinckii]NMF04419.1 metal-dependent hydrolase [Clostridium beijerinckii]NRU39252.1 inner membrane protein [Clostridium beijerinckii]NSA97469.1 inner membrane protein [Clostridium beijerinckii]OOM62105.1 inner membrane protein YdjM [Clostridium beijerinckii]